jgi:hypothetical protein
MADFTITQTLTFKLIADVLCSFTDSNYSEYWAEITELKEPTSWEFQTTDPQCDDGHWSQDYPLNPGGAIMIKDIEDDDNGIMLLNQETLQKGLQILAEKYPDHFANITKENSDAETADCLVQCSLLGDIIYS